MKFGKFDKVGAKHPSLIDDQGKRGRDLSVVIADLVPNMHPNLRWLVAAQRSLMVVAM